MTEARAGELAQQVVARCRELALVTDVPGETTRTFLSEGMRRTNERVGTWMQEAGLAVSVDAAGNLRGVLAGSSAGAPHFLIASHLDTVPNAGAFDGTLGVLLGIALAQECGSGALPYSLEVLGFSEEEGVRFGVPFLGSRALVGTLDEATLAMRDAQGVSVREAMQQFGLSAEVSTAKHENALGCLEFHIEQGPVLDTEDLPLGSVETILGQSRYELTFTGRANHAGTTPMRLRHDAMCAAAGFIVGVEQYAASNRGVVATVGSIHASPNAGNVIAGEVRISLDVRSALNASREDAVQYLLAAARATASSRGMTLRVEERLAQPSVPLDQRLLGMLEDSIDANGTMIRRMASGAGHDAMVLAPHMPTAMLFLRSPDGISHHPNESVRTDDVALALRVGYTFLQKLAASTPVAKGGAR